MNKGKASTFTCLLILLLSAWTLILVNAMVSHNISFAASNERKFNESDFMIKDFGIGSDGNPFLIVEGTAGGTIAQKENTALMYIFVTDNGTYGAMSDWSYTKWHSYGITLDENNCMITLNNKGGAEVDDVIRLTKTNATKVDKVMTAEYSINDSDVSICPTKIFDSAP